MSEPVTRLEQLLTRGARLAPQKAAVVCGKAELTYGQLDRASTALALRLRAAGVEPGQRVALYCPKGIPAVVGLFAVMKAGGAYVPLDVTGPLARALSIVSQCGIRVLLCTRPQLRKLAAAGADLAETPLTHALVLEEKDPQPPEPDEPPLAGSVVQDGFSIPAGCLTEADPADLDRPPRRAEDAAYILYTSGSTGTPKGVTISHRTSLFFVSWAARTVGLTSADRCSNHAPLYFDLSVFDIFSTLLAGATVVIVPPAYSAFPRSLGKYIQQQRITTWYSVPSTLMDLMREGDLAGLDLSALRTVIFAGEVFPLPALRQLWDLLPGRRMHNWYGPTETNVCTAHELLERPAEDAREIPIGPPCEGLTGLLLDETDRPVQGPGEGELIIVGPAVMQGYWGMPAETARTVAALPGGVEGYRTGDIVRRDGDGQLWFVGRKDHMVKVRGYRIELGEVEAALAAVTGVLEGAAVAVADGAGGNRLVAFVVAEAAAALTPQGCLDALNERLPHYMIPSEARVLERLPRTLTGKVDRRELAKGLEPGGG